VLRRRGLAPRCWDRKGTVPWSAARDRENSMLRSVKALRGYRIQASDGDIGQIHDCYFDDRRWTIRYLSAGVGHWLPRRHVLIPPLALRALDETGATLHVTLTKAQVRDSPGIDTDKPVSRQHAIELAQYFGFPYDWNGPALRPLRGQPAGDPHLRSAREVTGYSVHGVYDKIGGVDDLLVDDTVWAIRYIVVDIWRAWPGKKVLLASEWIERVSWEWTTVETDVQWSTIRDAPEYDPNRPIDRGYETRLYEHYHRPKYWEEKRSRSRGERQ
jgi:hypothetical protein